MSFFFYTLPTYDQTQYRPIGQVIATHVEAVSRGRAFLADLVGMFGNKSDLLTKKVDDATAGVLTTLQEKALAKYPNAVGIVGLNYSLSEISSDENSNFISLIASGTVLVSVNQMKQSAGRKTRRNRRQRNRCTN